MHKSIRMKMNTILSIFIYMVIFIMTALLVAVVMQILFSPVHQLTYTVSGLISLLILYAIISELISKVNNNYYVRQINSEEYELIKNRNLIRYQFSDIGYHESGYISFLGNVSAESNYTLRFSEKRDPVTWFHISDKDYSSEPTLDSYLKNHGLKKGDPQYKILVEVKNVPQEDIYVRPKSQAVIIKGSKTYPAKKIENFSNYNEKVYYWHTIKMALYLFHPTSPQVIGHQRIGHLIDVRKKLLNK